MDEYTIMLAIILLVGAAGLARLWVLVGRADDELFGTKSDILRDKK